MTGCDAPALLGSKLAEIVLAEDRPFLNALLRRLRRAGLRLNPVMLPLQGTAENPVPVVLAGCRLPDVTDACHLAITEAHAGMTAATLEQHDPTTGLLVRGDFEERAAEYLRIAKDQGRELGLTFIELEDFAHFLEHFGEERGDALLSDVGGALRATSVAGNAAGRLDRARFGVLHEADVAPAQLLSDVDGLAREADPSGSVGVAMRNLSFPMGRITAEDGANVIGFAVTQFISQGTSGLAHTTAEGVLKELVSATVQRAATFKSTIAEGRFQLVYQPIVDLVTRNIHHYEALTRFEEGGSPYETIRFAEGVSLIGEFDLVVCRRALATLRVLCGTGAPIAVNLSGRSIASDVFVAALRALLLQYPECRRDLMFEVTESTQIDDLERARNVIRVLREDAHRVGLDDFGTGSASFPYLRALTVDFVKIDGAYVRQAVSDKRDRAILKSMTTLCRELKIDTIAEMVETDDQAALLSVTARDGCSAVPVRCRRSGAATRHAGVSAH
jgi:EAL domain-containing protein (putative c-di-GMP-specific phosphodiesterase class I)/GGDEF domain-containing protein